MTTKNQEAEQMSDEASKTASSIILPYPSTIRTAVILSPLRKLGQRKRRKYCQALAAWCIREAAHWPVSTFMLLDTVFIPGEDKDIDRDALELQRRLINEADLVIAGIDYGVSAGMKDGIDHAKNLDKEVRFECIGQVDESAED